MSEFFSSVNFREKSIWVSTAIMLYVWIWYIDIVGTGLLDGTVTREGTIGVFIGMTVLLVFLEVVSHIILAIVSPKDAQQRNDERDRLINQRAESHSAWMLGAGIIAIAMSTMFRDLSGVVVVHLLLMLMIAIEILSNGLQMVYYRRGM
jgi:hypothetical protein